MKTIVFYPKVEQNGHLIEDAIIIKETVLVFINFDRSLPPIYTAKLSKNKKGVIYAEFQNTELKGFYPYIGGGDLR